MTNTNDYFDYCESIFRNWIRSVVSLNTFKDDYCIDYLPEPYLIFKDGDKNLFVLNNNPGGPIPCQERSVILRKYPNKNYRDVAAGMVEYYSSDAFKNNSDKNCKNAASRNEKMLDFAKNIGCDGVVNLETFFLHREDMNKNQFLKEYRHTRIVKEYTRLLSEYLVDKTVLAISAGYSGRSLTQESIKENAWIQYQCEIIGLENLQTAEIYPITNPDKHPARNSSAIFKKGNKFLIVMMGTNNLPVIPDGVYREMGLCPIE